MIPRRIKIKGGKLPDRPGVYLYKDKRGKVIYVGKAASLKRRVSSYFNRPLEARIAQMASEVREIDYIQKPTAIEALILEANLIKYYFPPYNIKDKDNKSFLYLVITKEDFPKPLLIRGYELGEDASKKYKAIFGPYTSPRSLRAALDLIRKAFPWSVCESPSEKVPSAQPARRLVHRSFSEGGSLGKGGCSVQSGKKKREPRACFYYHLKLCPGVCIGAISKKEYGKIIRDLIKFFEGKKDDILKQYKKDMKVAAKEKRFEEAASLRNKIFFLEHIQDIAILKREDDDVDKIREGEMSILIFGRVEGYDISNISGTSSVASMAVFENGAPAKAEYRKFRIKSVAGSNDVASIRETLMRRFRRQTPSGSSLARGRNWRHPDLILIDGGKPQVNAATQVIRELELGIPVVGLAKGAKRKKDELICDPSNLALCAACIRHKDILIALRDEAHRFAIKYHRGLRSRNWCQAP